MRAARSDRICERGAPPAFAPVTSLCIFVLPLSSKSIHGPDAVYYYKREEDGRDKRADAGSRCDRIRNAFAVRKPRRPADEVHANAVSIAGAAIDPAHRSCHRSWPDYGRTKH